MKIIKKYSNRKTLALQVLDGIVYVRAPYHTPDLLIDNFLDAKKDWLQKKLALYQPLGFTGKDTLKIFGLTYNVIKHESLKPSISLNQETLTLKLAMPGDRSESWVAAKLDDFLKKELDRVLKGYLKQYSDTLGIKIPNYKIRKYKRLYGRCSRSGDLAFNTYLYHEKHEFIEYVVVHELAHLYEFNHSKRFYDVVSKMMPHYKRVLNDKKHAK